MIFKRLKEMFAIIGRSLSLPIHFIRCVHSVAATLSGYSETDSPSPSNFVALRE